MMYVHAPSMAKFKKTLTTSSARTCNREGANLNSGAARANHIDLGRAQVGFPRAGMATLVLFRRSAVPEVRYAHRPCTFREPTPFGFRCLIASYPWPPRFWHCQSCQRCPRRPPAGSRRHVFGVTVGDPYRWLETTSARSRMERGQNAYTRAYLDCRSVRRQDAVDR
jgi:hypothetical protein